MSSACEKLTVHKVVPSESAYLPIGHSEQSLTVEAYSLYLPWTQTIHTPATVTEYVPPAQSVQVELPADAYFPAPHSVQSVAPALQLLPATQVIQSLTFSDPYSALALPPSQFRQVTINESK